VSGPQWPHLILSGKSKETARGTCNKWAWPAILGRVELLLHIIYDNLDSVADRRPPYPDLRSQVFGFRLSAFGSRWASPFHSSPVRQVIWLTERSHWRCACEHHITTSGAACGPQDWIRLLALSRRHLPLLPVARLPAQASEPRLMRSDMFK